MPDPTTTEQPTIPRLPNERPERYAARVAYIVAGPDRSLEAVRQKIGKRSVRRLELWSSEDDWVGLARQWDDLMVNLRTRATIDAYRRDLEAHRKKAMDAGRSLFQVGAQLLSQVSTALANPRKIEGKDGKIYNLHGIDLNSASLATAARALTAALDLEAHALGVDRLLPTLETDDHE